MSSSTREVTLVDTSADGIKGFLPQIRRYRFTLLLISLVLLLLISPVLEANDRGVPLLSLLFSLVLLAAVISASNRRWTLWVALAFAMPWIYLTWLHPLWRADTTDVIASSLLACLGLFVLGVVLSGVFRSPRVDADALCGAIAAYLLVAVTWAVSYVLIEALIPGSFSLTGVESESLWNQLLYFSLVTLTTLGYGDISPLGAPARLWSALEAVVGTLYLTVLVARLVSLYRGSPGVEG